MTQNHNTLILAAGSSFYYLPDGSQISKLEFEISGQPLIERIISTYQSGNTFLATPDENGGVTTNQNQIKRALIGNTKGALISALIAIRDCDLNLPIFITPGDALVAEEKYKEFCSQSLQSNSEISLMVFDSQNPKFSYIRMRDEKLVEVCEKKVISSKATAGIFYFNTAHLFIECAEWAIMNNIQTKGLFFLAPALNYAVVKGLNPTLFQIDERDYYRFSTHEEAMASKKRFRNDSK
jgi:bifunctional N-acetylglucosamine-1-phosphate-uridyltransferase/glucosamine-1-phosphate-acetyltransferase GlmU-like protein